MISTGYHGYHLHQDLYICTLLNHSGLFFLASANVEPKPAIIPADATVVRNAAPAHRKSGSLKPL